MLRSQSAAVVAVTNVFDNIEDVSIRRMVIPKVKSVFEKNLADPKIVQNVLICIDGLMDKLERTQVNKLTKFVYKTSTSAMKCCSWVSSKYSRITERTTFNLHNLCFSEILTISFIHPLHVKTCFSMLL